MKKIVGYVRSIPGGVGISNVPVSIRLQKDSTLIPAGGMIQASTNPINTDADGRFEWTCELSPGPLKAEAAIDGTAELKVRVGEEVMQAGDIFISDIVTMGKMFTNGVIDDLGSKMAVSPVTGSLSVTVGTGAMNLHGRILQLETPRTIVIAGNPTLDTRIDVIYAEHVHSGPDTGKQNIGIIQGTVNNTAPAIPAVSDTWRLEVGRVTIPKGATSVTTVSNAPIASPSSVSLDAGQVELSHLASEVRTKLNDQLFTTTSPATGDILEYNGTRFVNVQNTISRAFDTTIASPVNNQVLTYNGGKWQNLALPAAPVVSIAGASDSVVSSPANGQVLTYWVGAWRNIALPAAPVVSIANASDSTITSPTDGQLLGYTGGRWRNVNLNIDIPSGKYAESSFNSYGNLSNNVIIATCSVTVPAGTWLLKGEAYGQAYYTGSTIGSFNQWFQGSAVTHANARVHTTQPNWRQWYHSVGRVVTVYSTTTFTLDLWAAHQTGTSPTHFGTGKMSLMAI